ncbi:hypothetical protein COV49_03365 [Candidatus Falkowbacteria bacterium CG11_big_fil_rev_8_21_14_0_20_39_10]|uniref:Uncharacterized protein n=1 Tax=Candidatus Falkowbacteria bacterium CG11_big_fil_rev_8_21_14_0_20_39_10 TaxID=1974570 RepID=A0A2M6K8H7_9BACT|nr:MAG: hypothetical protein COV49_03365 [Candidatus Falkowbacteria bacterium CG11_big_fil_rev_8_21_14_0_20_39_10]
MITNTQDILNLVKAGAVGLLAIFICWAIYYFAMIMRQILKVIKEMRERLQKVDEVLKTLKEKIEHSTSYLLLIGEGMKKLVEVARDYTGKEKAKKKRKKK